MKYLHSFLFLILSISCYAQCNCGTFDTATATPVGSPPYTYLWSNSATTQSINIGEQCGNAAYTVTVTDDCGTTAVQTYNVSVTQPNVSIFGNSSSCQLIAIRSGCGSTYNYEWTSPTNVVTTTTTSILNNITECGIWTVKITCGNCPESDCVATATTNYQNTNCCMPPCNSCTANIVTQAPPVCGVIRTFSNSPSCVNAQSYNWTITLNGNQVANSSNSTINYIPNANGNYVVTLTLTDDCGITSTDTYSFTITGCINCGCATNFLALNNTSCQLSWAACTGYTAALQYFNGVSWVTVSTSSPHSPANNGNYRVLYSKLGCPIITSNVVTVNCISTCDCVVTSFVTDDANCEIDVTVSGADCGDYGLTIQKTGMPGCSMGVCNLISFPLSNGTNTFNDIDVVANDCTVGGSTSGVNTGYRPVLLYNGTNAACSSVVGNCEDLNCGPPCIPDIQISTIGSGLVDQFSCNSYAFDILLLDFGANGCNCSTDIPVSFNWAINLNGMPFYTGFVSTNLISNPPSSITTVTVPISDVCLLDPGIVTLTLSNIVINTPSTCNLTSEQLSLLVNFTVFIQPSTLANCGC